MGVTITTRPLAYFQEALDQVLFSACVFMQRTNIGSVSSSFTCFENYCDRCFLLTHLLRASDAGKSRQTYLLRRYISPKQNKYTERERERERGCGLNSCHAFCTSYIVNETRWLHAESSGSSSSDLENAKDPVTIKHTCTETKHSQQPCTLSCIHWLCLYPGLRNQQANNSQEKCY